MWMKTGQKAVIGALGLAVSSLIAAGAAMAEDCKTKVPDSALIKPGMLVMATNPTLPPMQFVDANGDLKGMRITLGNEIAKRLCLSPEYIRIEFSAMIPGLQAGRWDVINTGIFWNEKRAAIMKMIPYESQAISISVPVGNPERHFEAGGPGGQDGRRRDRRLRGSQDQTLG